MLGIYYLAFVAANKLIGYVGGLFETMPTTTFWLFHVATAGIGPVAFVVFKLVLGKRLTQSDAHAEDAALA